MIVKGGVHAFIVNVIWRKLEIALFSARFMEIILRIGKKLLIPFNISFPIFILIFSENTFHFFFLNNFVSYSSFAMATSVATRIIFVLRNRPSNRYQLKRNSSLKLINLTTVRKEKVDCDSVSVHFYYGAAEAMLICHAKIQADDFSIRWKKNYLNLFIIYRSIKYIYCFLRSDNFLWKVI